MAKTLERSGKTSSSNFCGRRLADSYSLFFSLIHTVLLDEFSFEEMRTWNQCKISFCCLCIWCKSKELRGRGSPRAPTPMVESFSVGLLPAKKLLHRVAFGITNIASAKLRRARRVFHQPAFMDSCLTINCTRLACRASR